MLLAASVAASRRVVAAWVVVEDTALGFPQSSACWGLADCTLQLTQCLDDAR